MHRWPPRRMVNESDIARSPGISRLNGLVVWFSLWVREAPGSNPGWALVLPLVTRIQPHWYNWKDPQNFWTEAVRANKGQNWACSGTRFYGVMVSTQDSESCDPSSSLGRTWVFRIPWNYMKATGDEFHQTFPIPIYVLAVWCDG